MSSTKIMMEPSPQAKAQSPSTLPLKTLSLKTDTTSKDTKPQPKPTPSSSSVAALLSPAADEPPTTTGSAQLPAEEELESVEMDDDARFSTVPLSAAPSEPSESDPHPPSNTFNNHRRESVSSTTNMEISLQTPRTSTSATLASVNSQKDDGKPGVAVAVAGTGAGKGASTGSGSVAAAIKALNALNGQKSEKAEKAEKATKRRPPSLISPGPASSASSSNPNAEFILAKLEKDMMSPTKPGRSSIDGKNLLQEEFLNARKAKEDEVKDSKPSDGIDWDFWGLVMSDYDSFAKSEPKKLARAIEAGIPPALRGMVWQLMSASKDPELEQIYANLLKESSPYEKAIARDLGRTFPHHAFFTDGQGVGQESLFNVLKAYSLFDPECGYCQGLPFIVAPLLLVCPDEEAFCLLVRIMQSYELRGHYLPEMPGLTLRLFQFDRLIEDTLPVLHLHFLRQGIKSSMFCSQWFLTLFAYRFPLDMVFRIFDHVLATGVDAIFSFSVVLLQKNEKQLLNLNFDQTLEFLKTSLLDPYKTEEELNDGEEERILVDDFVRDASALRITPFQLDGYAGEYAELRRAQTAHLMEMDNLRNENRYLKTQVKKLEDSLAQVETEHCDVIKQLVMAKIEKEEYEAELVRFKLLYAESMHQHAENGTSNRTSSISQSSGSRKFSTASQSLFNAFRGSSS